MTEARIQHFYHEPTGTLSYVVWDEQSGHAAVVDTVLGYSMVSGRIDPAPSDVIIEFVHKEKLGLEWILETHAHADHITGAQYIKSRLGGAVAIGEGIRSVQAHFGPVFNLGPPFSADGHQFDKLLSDGDTLQIGQLECQVIATPGHTSDTRFSESCHCQVIRDSSCVTTTCRAVANCAGSAQSMSSGPRTST